MMKMTTCLAIILIACFATVKLIDIQLDEDQSWSAVAALDKKIHDKTVNYYTFKDSFDATLLSLRKGEITLADAMERVNGLAQHFHTDYFTHIALSEIGSTSEERVARNLVGHVAASTRSAEPSAPGRLAQLRLELAEFLEKSARRRSQ